MKNFAVSSVLITIGLCIAGALFLSCGDSERTKRLEKKAQTERRSRARILDVTARIDSSVIGTVAVVHVDSLIKVGDTVMVNGQKVVIIQ